jgi:cytochrome bd-type quinol oxidase subunit 1
MLAAVVTGSVVMAAMGAFYLLCGKFASTPASSCEPAPPWEPYDIERFQRDNPLLINAMSFLTFWRWGAEVKGLKDFPRDKWPDNIALLYHSYHVMVGIGTVLILLTTLSAAPWHAGGFVGTGRCCGP